MEWALEAEPRAPLGPLHVSVGVVVKVSVVSGLDVHYPEEKLLTHLFSIENNLSIYAL